MHHVLIQVILNPTSPQQTLEPCLTTRWRTSPTNSTTSRKILEKEKKKKKELFLAFTYDIVAIFNCSLIAVCINPSLAIDNSEAYKGVQCNRHAYICKGLKMN